MWSVDVCDIPHEYHITNLEIPAWNYQTLLSELERYYEPDNPVDDRMITNPLTAEADQKDYENTSKWNYKLWEIIPDPWTEICDTITRAVGMLTGNKMECLSLTTSIMEPGDYTIPHFHPGTIHALWYLSDTDLDDLVFYSFMDHEYVPVEYVKIKPNNLVVFSGNIAHGTEDLTQKRLVIALTLRKKTPIQSITYAY